MADAVLQSPSPAEIREQLQEAVVRDLLGPAGGAEEELEENVRDRYLVGLLAPRRQRLTPEEFDELAVGGEGTVEEGSTDVGAPQAVTMFPSSFGLTFCVDGAATELAITTRWGFYDRVPSATLKTEAGNPRPVWKRRPIEDTRSVRLVEGKSRQPATAEFPDVTLQWLVRRHAGDWVVTIFLVNGQEEPKLNRDHAWLFQPEIVVSAPDGSSIFRRRPPAEDPGRVDPEDRAMAMVHRRQVEFAVGHGVSVHAELAPDVNDRAVRISTRVVPVIDVPQVTAPTATDTPALGQVALDMQELAETESAAFGAKLGPLVTAYRDWIERERARIADPAAALGGFEDAARESMSRCAETLGRIEAGLALLGASAEAADAFRFMNRAMWQQRIRSLYAERSRRGETPELAALDVPGNRSWYPFQLAFILLNLPALTDLRHAERTDADGAIADLLWFPTGGGKTEAYLGLAAYTMAIRRLHGAVAGRSGEHGVAVLMRYTLRLLTLQQFQRAAALLCACEVIRREALASGDARWGTSPFRIGLWVGQRTTPNTTEQAAEVLRQAHGARRATIAAGIGTPRQLTNCPWCGARIEPGRHLRVETVAGGRGRTFTFCGDTMGRCPFTEAQAPGEGLPIVVVDEEIYRLLPAMLVATVDKFAQTPWNGATQMLFGQVDGVCGRHGFRSPEIEDEDSHRARANLPATKTVPSNPLRPPDLIIQDELHLISGPLGSLVGLYETAVDRLAAWDVDGKLVRPKVIASTATIRRAADQVHGVFARRVRVFPPHGLDAADNFFARQRPAGDAHPGRRYLGICAPGRRLKAALIRVYVAFLGASQQGYEKYGRAADPWMTLVGYFNAMRELGGMRRLIDDDVRTRLARIDQRGLAVRNLSWDSVEELTSRKSGADIPDVLDALERPFDPELEARRRDMRRLGQMQGLPPRPLDVLLATNMLSVGVDVRRLGLMVVAGQPKTTAEYIQATSRVGRAWPGLVCTVLNWVRPRDLSHYERFEYYHATFYTHVEALSVTPFAPRAIDRGLAALLVACIRLMGTEFNENLRAGRIDRSHPYVRAAIEQIVRRAHLVSSREVADLVRSELEHRLDLWLEEAQRVTGGRRLGYREARDQLTVGLLRRPELGPWHDFTCLNSLRDVEPEVALVLDDRGLDDESLPVSVVPDGDDQEPAP